MKQREFDFKSFIASVKVHRTVLDISLRTAATQMNMYAGTLSRIENGTSAEMNNVITICDWMGHPIEQFIKAKK